MLFDKPRCQRRLSAAGVPVPESFGAPTGFDEVSERLRTVRRAFLKSAHGSSASGVVALHLDAQWDVFLDNLPDPTGDEGREVERTVLPAEDATNSTGNGAATSSPDADAPAIEEPVTAAPSPTEQVATADLASPQSAVEPPRT